jgi:hypothetical protein
LDGSVNFISRCSEYVIGAATRGNNRNFALDHLSGKFGNSRGQLGAVGNDNQADRHGKIFLGWE